MTITALPTNAQNEFRFRVMEAFAARGWEAGPPTDEEIEAIALEAGAKLSDAANQALKRQVLAEAIEVEIGRRIDAEMDRRDVGDNPDGVTIMACTRAAVGRIDMGFAISALTSFYKDLEREGREGPREPVVDPDVLNQAIDKALEARRVST